MKPPNKLDYADPDDHAAMFALARRMFDILSEGVLAGYSPASLASAVAMLNGLYLAGPYSNPQEQKVAMGTIGRVSLSYAKQAGAMFRRINAGTEDALPS